MSVSTLPRVDVCWIGRLALRIHLERLALDDAQHQRREAAVVLRRRRARSRGRAACRGTRRRVRAHRSAASRWRPRRTGRSSSSTASCAAATGPSIFVLSNSLRRRRIDRRAFVVRCATAPMPSKFSSAKPIGSISRWHCTQSGAHAMVSASSCASSAPWRSGPRRAAAAAARPAAGSGGLMPRTLVMIHLPRVTGDVRSGFERRRQERALAEQTPARVHVGTERHAAELAAVDVRDPVVLGQPLVDERVVGVEQVERRCDLRGRSCRRAARLPSASPDAADRRSRDRAAAAGRRRRGRAGSATGRRS